MQLRSGKVILSTVFSISSNVKGDYELRSGRVVIRSKHTPRRYIKRKYNIELRSGRLVSHKEYKKRSYIKRKYNIELRSGRLVSHNKYTKRPYNRRPKHEAHIEAMLDHYKFNHLIKYSSLLHLTGCDHRKTVDMVRDWEAGEQRYKEFMALNNPKNYYNEDW